MRTSKQALTHHLRSIDPIGEENLAYIREGSAAEELLSAIVNLETAVPDREYVDRMEQAARRPLMRRFLAPAALTAVALLALGVSLFGGRSSDDVVAALDRVAAAAAAQPTPADRPYHYLETRSTTIDTAIAKGESWSVYSTETREEWVGEDRPGRLRVTVAPPRFVGPGDRAAWEAAGRPDFLASGFAGRTFERRLPAGEHDGKPPGPPLPADPERLSDVFAQRAAQVDNSAPPAARTLDLIAAALRDPSTSPALRSALYEAAKTIPGLELLGEATDSAGREGLAVGVTSTYSGGRTLYSLLYDPDTSQVLETRSTALDRVEFADADPPLVTSATTYIDSH